MIASSLIPADVSRSKSVGGRGNLRKEAAHAASGLAKRLGQRRWAEFGVWRGKSARDLLKLLPPGKGQLHLFDSFEGLPEEWQRGLDSDEYCERHVKGHFACDVPNLKDSRARIHKGLFEDTLHEFRDKHPHMVFDLAHIDCDIYSSTVTVLEAMRTTFVQGTVLIFDDFHGYPKWRDGQHRAWREWIGKMPYTWIAHTKKGGAAVMLDESWG